MTPSKEALSAAKRLMRMGGGFVPSPDCPSPEVAAGVIDTAFAPYHERVRRLVEAAREARDQIDAYRMDLNCWQWSAVGDGLDAALAPFLEQEAP